jgi:hypothetical protein
MKSAIVVGTLLDWIGYALYQVHTHGGQEIFRLGEKAEFRRQNSGVVEYGRSPVCLEEF